MSVYQNDGHKNDCYSGVCGFRSLYVLGTSMALAGMAGLILILTA